MRIRLMLALLLCLGLLAAGCGRQQPQSAHNISVPSFGNRNGKSFVYLNPHPQQEKSFFGKVKDLFR